MAAGFYQITSRLAASSGYSYSAPTWTRFDSGYVPSGSTTSFFALCSLPEAPNTVFLVPREASGSTTRVMRSTTRGGSPWVQVGQIFAERITWWTPHQLYAQSANNLFFLYGATNSANNGIWRSVDGGANWSKIRAFGASWPGGGWMAIASSKVFYAQWTTTPTTSGNPTMEIRRLNFDGSGHETFASYTLQPTVTAGGHFNQWPDHMLLRAIDDDTLLAASVNGDHAPFGVEYVPAQTVVLSTTDTPIGNVQTITPEWNQNFGAYQTRIYVEYESASNTIASVYFSLRYQEDGGAWSSLISVISGTAQATPWRILGIAGVPSGARAVQIYARRSATATTLTGLRVSEVFSTGFVWCITPSGIRDIRPANLRRPWDVLPLTNTRWLAVGGVSEAVGATVAAGGTPGPAADVLVYRSDDAGDSWTLEQTITSSEGFIPRSLREEVHLLAASDSASSDSVALLGNASASVQQIVWVSSDGGGTWTLIRNTAEPGAPGSWSVTWPGGIEASVAVKVVLPVATPSRLATIVG